MRILYVSQYFPPEMGAPGARVSELSRHWVRAGHEVTVLTGFPNHPTGVVPPNYRGKLRRLVLREQYDGINVVRTWLWPLPNRKTHERLLNYASFCLSACVTGLFVRRPDVVIATSPQLLVGLSGWWLAKWKRVPFVFEVRDLWPESLNAVGVKGERSLLYQSLAVVSNFLYRACSRLVVVTPAFKEHIAERNRISRERISIVLNGVETALFSPRPDTAPVLAELGLQGRFVVSYIGTMGNAHGLETVLQAAAALREAHPEIAFLLVGEGAEKERLGEMARSRALGNLTILDQQPRGKIPALVSASDVCLVLLKDTEIFKTVIPTKMLEFMSCARPVILGVEGEARAILEAAGGGICIHPEATDELVSAILLLAGNPELRSAMGARGRDYIASNLSRENLAHDYLGILQDLITARAAGVTAAQ